MFGDLLDLWHFCKAYSWEFLLSFFGLLELTLEMVTILSTILLYTMHKSVSQK